MYFDPFLLDEKLDAIMTKQNDPDFVPREVREAKMKKAKKAAAAVKEKAERDISKRVKEVAMARKIKEYNKERGFDDDAESAFGDPAGPKRKKLPNRQLDLENKIVVRIDSKTIVYVDPGTDIAAIRAKYNKKTKKERLNDEPEEL